MIPLFLLSGFFIPAKECPYYFLPFQYLSWFYYGTENLLINQWTVSKVCISLDITQGKIFFSCHKFPYRHNEGSAWSEIWSVSGTHRYPKIFSCRSQVPSSTQLLKFSRYPVPSGTQLLKFSRYPVPSGTQDFEILMGTGRMPTPGHNPDLKCRKMVFL